MFEQDSRPNLAVGSATTTRLLLRPEEAAEVLGISRSRFYVLLAQKQIRSIKLGRSRRIPLVELERWIAQQVEATQTQFGPSSELR